MELTLAAHLAADDRERVAGRLREDLIGRMAAVFGTQEGFAGLYSQAVVISPTRLHS